MPVVVLPRGKRLAVVHSWQSTWALVVAVVEWLGPGAAAPLLPQRVPLQLRLMGCVSLVPLQLRLRAGACCPPVGPSMLSECQLHLLHLAAETQLRSLGPGCAWHAPLAWPQLLLLGWLLVAPWLPTEHAPAVACRDAALCCEHPRLLGWAWHLPPAAHGGPQRCSQQELPPDHHPLGQWSTLLLWKGQQLGHNGGFRLWLSSAALAAAA